MCTCIIRRLNVWFIAKTSKIVLIRGFIEGELSFFLWVGTQYSAEWLCVKPHKSRCRKNWNEAHNSLNLENVDDRVRIGDLQFLEMFSAAVGSAWQGSTSGVCTGNPAHETVRSVTKIKDSVDQSVRTDDVGLDCCTKLIITSGCPKNWFPGVCMAETVDGGGMSNTAKCERLNFTQNIDVGIRL